MFEKYRYIHRIEQMRKVSLSEYGEKSLTPSPVSSMLNQLSGVFRDGIDINLGVGYVSENTLSNAAISTALTEVLRQRGNCSEVFNYGRPKGSENLISSIRRYYVNYNIGNVTQSLIDEKEIVIGANGSTSLLEAVSRVMSSGIVVTSDPKYYIYSEFLERVGYEVLAVPEDDEGVVPCKLKALLSSRPADDFSYFYLSTINNPTGVVLSNTRRRELIDIISIFSLQRKRPLPVILDRAYEDLVHDSKQSPLQSGMLFDVLGIVYEIGTFSKVLAPALRIGYMIGPPGELLDAIAQRVSDIGFSASLMNQEIVSWLLDHNFDEQLSIVNGEYRQKSNVIETAINELLGPWLKRCTGGCAGFYFYITFKEIETHINSPFFKWLNRTTGVRELDYIQNERAPKVIYIPGSFCVQSGGELESEGQRSLRICYSYESTERCLESLHVMAEAAQWAMSQLPSKNRQAQV